MGAAMSDTDEMGNPAMQRVVKLKASPGAVAEAMEDASVFEQIARGDLYVELTRLRKLAASNAMPVKLRMEYAQMLSKMGKVERPVQEKNPLDGVPAINIYLPGSGQNTRIGATLQGEYTREDD